MEWEKGGLHHWVHEPVAEMGWTQALPLEQLDKGKPRQTCPPGWGAVLPHL